MKIAITGNIGSGKSLVSEYLRSKGFYVFDCDKYNNELIENNKDVFNEIYKEFPECIEHLRINKKKLADIVFSDKDKKYTLERIVHPLIMTKMIEESKKTELFFAEVPLLYEMNISRYFDITILVASDKQITNMRLLKKGYTQEQIDKRESFQLPVLYKAQRANEIIYNNDSYKDLYKEIDKLLEKYDWE